MNVLAFDRFGKPTDAAALLRRYNARLTRAEDRNDEPPVTPGARVGRLAIIREVYGFARLFVTVPPGYGVRRIIPGVDQIYSAPGGTFVQELNTRDHTYFPIAPEPQLPKAGPLGFSVGGVLSDYVDQLGIAFGVYDDQPDSVRPKEPYGHLDLTFTVETAAALPAAPSPAPTTPVPTDRGVWVSADDLIRLRAAGQQLDDLIRAIVNREPGR